MDAITTNISSSNAKKHLFNGVYSMVEEIDLTRIRWKMCESREATLECDQFDKGVVEYRRFLSLKKLYPEAILVPNKLVDKIWHAHILDTKAYRSDCNNLFGYFLDHFPYFGIYGEDDEKKLIAAFEETKELYERHYGPYPDELNCAERCGDDHACHAPSDCACRVPGACK